MNDLTPSTFRIAPTSEADLERVREIQGALLELPQVTIPTHHVLHGGMYARTIRIPAGVALAGAYVKVPTVLILSGEVTVLANDRAIEIQGYQVIPASSDRKQAFVAHTDTELTMIFATAATTVEEAEAEFTSEPELLASRQSSALNVTIITGE